MLVSLDLDAADAGDVRQWAATMGENTVTLELTRFRVRAWAGEASIEKIGLAGDVIWPTWTRIKASDLATALTPLPSTGTVRIGVAPSGHVKVWGSLPQTAAPLPLPARSKEAS